MIILASVAVLLLGGWYVTRAQPSSEPPEPPAATRVNVEHALDEPAQSSVGVAIDASRVDLGRVPLNKEVTHAFRLINGGVEPVRLGRATIQVLEGC